MQISARDAARHRLQSASVKRHSHPSPGTPERGRCGPTDSRQRSPRLRGRPRQVLLVPALPHWQFPANMSIPSWPEKDPAPLSGSGPTEDVMGCLAEGNSGAAKQWYSKKRLFLKPYLKQFLWRWWLNINILLSRPSSGANQKAFPQSPFSSAASEATQHSRPFKVYQMTHPLQIPPASAHTAFFSRSLLVILDQQLWVNTEGQSTILCMYVLIPGSGRSPGGRHGNPLQYSCLENPHGQRSLTGYVRGVAKSWTWLKWLSMQTPFSTKDTFYLCLQLLPLLGGITNTQCQPSNELQISNHL